MPLMFSFAFTNLNYLVSPVIDIQLKTLLTAADSAVLRKNKSLVTSNP